MLRTLLSYYKLIVTYLYSHIITYLYVNILIKKKNKNIDYQLSIDEETELLISDYEYEYEYDKNNYNKNNYKNNYKHFMETENHYIIDYSLKKSISISFPLRYCGWCNINIQIPTYVYMDKIYCNINCMNCQIKKDFPTSYLQHKCKK
jgi:hypothetical protein